MIHINIKITSVLFTQLKVLTSLKHLTYMIKTIMLVLRFTFKKIRHF